MGLALVVEKEILCKSVYTSSDVWCGVLQNSPFPSSEPQRRQGQTRMLDWKLEIAFAARIEENDSILNYLNESFRSCLLKS